VDYFSPSRQQNWRNDFMRLSNWYGDSSREHALITLSNLAIGFVILINCILIGMSLDTETWKGWRVFDCIFASIFVFEITFELKLIGCSRNVSRQNAGVELVRYSYGQFLAAGVFHHLDGVGLILADGRPTYLDHTSVAIPTDHIFRANILGADLSKCEGKSLRQAFCVMFYDLLLHPFLNFSYLGLKRNNKTSAKFFIA
jgi:hypothetical protein